MKKCVNCGAELSDDAGFCPKCGAPQPNVDQYGQQPPQFGGAADNSGMPFAIASLVCGILGLFVPYVGIVLAILGVVFGNIAKKKLPQGNTGMATAGIVLGWISIIVAIIGLVVGGIFLASIF